MGTGSLSTPFYITLDTGRPDGVAAFEDVVVDGTSARVLVLNKTVWAAARRLVAHVVRAMPQPVDLVTSLVQFPGMPANFSSVDGDALLLCASTGYHNSNYTQPCYEYQLLYNHTVDATRRMLLVVLAPPVNPFGTLAYDYVNSIHEAVTSFDTRGAFTLGFFGASAESWAILHSMNELLPLQLGVMFLVIFVVCFAVFRSVFIPLRMIITVAFPVSVALGAGALVFQVAPFNTVWAVKVTASNWLVPEFSFTLLCALALDYDIFLLTRVVEYRELGFTTVAALTKAVWKTGRIISFAGIIMMFSFGGMMFADVMMMVQFGFVAAFAVLTDTFVIRPMVVPALMSIVPDWVVWWPRKFKLDGTRGVDDMTEVDMATTNGGGADDDDDHGGTHCGGGGGANKKGGDDTAGDAALSSRLVGDAPSNAIRHQLMHQPQPHGVCAGYGAVSHVKV